MRNLQFADDIWRKIKLRNKYVKWFIKHKVAVLGVVACLLVGGLGFSIYKYKTDMNTLKTTDQQQIQTLQEQASSKSRTGYVATTDIKLLFLFHPVVQLQIMLLLQQWISS